MQKRIYHLDTNQDKLKEIAKRYSDTLDIRLMTHDGRFMLTSVSDAVDLDQVDQEMDLIPLQKYLRDSRALANQNNSQPTIK